MPTDYHALIKQDRVHGSLYAEPGVFQEEMERIFYQSWVFVGHDSEIAEPGAWITRRIGRKPFILTRDFDGEIHLVANRCAHRGTTLCWKERGKSRAFQCTYHGWTFALDGSLKGVPYPGGFEKDKSDLGLERPGQMESYRGFIFANLSGEAGPLSKYLGVGGTSLLNRLCELSPTGKIRLAPQWIGHRIESNWKMWPESDNDGYHFQFVHASMLRSAPDTYYEETILASETENKSLTVDRGGGHFELDLRPSYPTELAWLGVSKEKVPEYCASLESAYGQERAHQLMHDGPPHAMIFPNLFLGEMNLALIEPVAPGVTIHHHTAVQLEGVEARLNRRILRQSEAALGPASFIVPDDAVTAERIQAGFTGSNAHFEAPELSQSWIDISRGLAREVTDEQGHRHGHISDEITNRAFWHHYRSVMSGEV